MLKKSLEIWPTTSVKFSHFPLSSSSLWCHKHPKAWELQRTKTNSFVTAWLQTSVRSTLLSPSVHHAASHFISNFHILPLPSSSQPSGGHSAKRRLCVSSISVLLVRDHAPFYWEVDGLFNSLIIYSAIHLQVHSHHQMLSCHTRSRGRGIQRKSLRLVQDKLTTWGKYGNSTKAATKKESLSRGHKSSKVVKKRKLFSFVQERYLKPY